MTSFDAVPQMKTKVFGYLCPVCTQNVQFWLDEVEYESDLTGATKHPPTELATHRKFYPCGCSLTRYEPDGSVTHHLVLDP